MKHQQKLTEFQETGIQFRKTMKVSFTVSVQSNQSHRMKASEIPTGYLNNLKKETNGHNTCIGTSLKLATDTQKANLSPLKKNLFGHTRPQFQHVGCSSLSRDQTQAPCIGSMESLATGPPGKSLIKSLIDKNVSKTALGFEFLKIYKIILT